MNLQRVTVLLFSTALVSAALAAETNYHATKGSFEVSTLRIEWHDKKRDRDVPVKIYYPKDASGPFPVIIFSHGLGGSRDGYTYLGNEWASHGYVSVHVQHHGSDTAVWMNASNCGLQDAMKPQNASNRVVDIYFAISQLEGMNKESGPLQGKLDLQHIGVAGHSYGAWTTLVVGGQRITSDVGHEHRTVIPFRDPRIKAIIPMSSPVPGKLRLDEIYGSIQLPCLHMTGTLDDSPVAETKAADRRIPYDHMTGEVADEYLLTFNGGDHMVFSGRLSHLGSRAEHDHIFQKYIKEASTAFWDAYLKNNKSAKEWLADGEFKKALGKEGTFEMKLAPATNH
jgi:predicted dienelactone hydrolase